MARWFAYEAERVYVVLHETDGDKERRQIIELVRRKGGKIGEELQKAPPARLRELAHQMVSRIRLRFGKKRQGRRTIHPFLGGKVDLRPNPVMYSLVSRGDWI